MGRQQPHRIPRFPRDRNKITVQKFIIRLLSIYKRLIQFENLKIILIDN